MNFLGKYFKIALVAFFAVDFLSLFTFVFKEINVAVFVGILSVFLVLTLKKVEYGLYFVLAEIFIGGKGYLFSFDGDGTVISIRIALFVILLSVWMLRKFQDGKDSFKHLLSNKNLYPLYVFFLVLAYGTLNGIVNNSFGKAFFDLNAWIFFGLIFIFIENISSKKNVENILQILFAAVIAIGVKTAFVLYVFSHDVFFVGDLFYKWIRDTGVGEVTYISGTLFRVFFQSHIYSLINLLIIVALLFSRVRLNLKNALLVGLTLYISIFTIIVSQSRSFWLGGVVTIFIIFVYTLFSKRFSSLHNFSILAFFILITYSHFSTIQLVSGDYRGNIAQNRFENLQSESASKSRLNQLAPLSRAIQKNPIVGSGFGTEVTYKSNDPRVVRSNPNGLYTTSAFEWGYLDIILKIGLVGMVLYSIILFKPIYLWWKKYQNDPILFSLTCGLVGLLAVNMFTPYLNHPLGIAYVLMVFSITVALPKNHRSLK